MSKTAQGSAEYVFEGAAGEDGNQDEVMSSHESAFSSSGKKEKEPKVDMKLLSVK